MRRFVRVVWKIMKFIFLVKCIAVYAEEASFKAALKMKFPIHRTRRKNVFQENFSFLLDHHSLSDFISVLQPIKTTLI